MVRIGASPPAAAAAASATPALPKVSFTRVEDDAFSGLAGVPDGQARSYGYNDGSLFKLPEHYIRYIEPLESELAVQVEYDMDEQDQEWLDTVNAERRAANLDKVSYETFEVIMDRLEKEWFDLTKNLPKPDLAMPSEDSTCAICDDSEGENTNAIVFCDGCNLAVHQDCYGVPYIPEGQWLCRKCTVSPENPVSCILCPNEGGAFKQTVHGEWVHLLCAIWVPETRVANDVFMEPVTGVDRIPKQRWKLKCSICDVREGACIQCIKASCFSAFHATCARKEKFLMPMKASQGSEAPTLACYCEKHLPREHADARLAALASEQSPAEGTQTSKTARAYAKTYKPGPPLVPRIIVERLLVYIGKVALRQKRELVVMVCKYWSLKREARRGAPLLKRLHLEPWTASAGGRQSDEAKAVKLKLLKDLKEDLVRLRTLSDTVRRREIQKLRQQSVLQGVLQRVLYPFHTVMRSVFESIKSGDKQDYFLVPVSKTEVPDYYDVIKNPMSWSVIDEKLSKHAYMDLQDFTDDILLVLNNAMTYNKPDTPFYRTAQRIKKATERAFPDLDQFVTHHLQAPHPAPPEDAPPAIGNLEPSLRMLDLLIDAEHIQPDSKLVLDKPPLDALFAFELAAPKPPPPAAPAAPPAAPATVIVHAELASVELVQNKPKRDRKAERERAKEKRASVAGAGAQPRTRRARAAAGLPVDSPTPPAPSAPTLPSAPGTDAAPEDEGDGGEPPAKRRRRNWKRPQIVKLGRTDVPPVVQAVDSHTSFSMFDGGWILPEGQKRNRGGVEGGSVKDVKAVEPESEAVDVEVEVVEEGPEAGPSHVEEDAPSPPPSSQATIEDNAQEYIQATSPVIEPRAPSLHAEDVSMDVDVEQLLEAPPEGQTTVVEVEHTGDTTEEEPEPDQDVDAHGEPEQQPTGADSADVDPPTDEHAPVVEDVDVDADADDDADADAEGEPDEIQVEEALGHVADDEVYMSEDHQAPQPVFEEPVPVTQTGEVGHDAATPEPATPITEPALDPVESADDDVDQQSDLTALSDSESGKSPARQTAEAGDDLSSGELTELSPPPVNETPADEGPPEVEDAREEEPAPSSSKQGKSTKRKGGGGKKKAKPKKVIDPEAGKVQLKRGQALLEAGTLVWAKIPSYPWWPGVVYDPNDEVVPSSVKEGKTRKQLESNGLHIVQFFDDNNHWSLVPVTQILMLGEVEELDDDMTAWRSSRQKWKSQKVFRGCEKAFLRAREEMEG